MFAAERKPGLMHFPHDLIFLGIAGKLADCNGFTLLRARSSFAVFFIYFKLSALFLGITDPLAPFENFFCSIFMGGIWDSIALVAASSYALSFALQIDQCECSTAWNMSRQKKAEAAAAAATASPNSGGGGTAVGGDGKKEQ